MGDSDKKCGICGADFAGRTGKYSAKSGTSKILIAITAVSVAVTIAVILIFAVIPSLNKPLEENTPIEEISETDISVFDSAAKSYELYINGKLDEEKLSSLLPESLFDYLCSLYNFNKAEVLEAGYEKTSDMPVRKNLELNKASDIYVTVSVKEAAQCPDEIKAEIEKRICENFRSASVSVSEVSLLSVSFSYNAAKNSVPGVFSLTGYESTVPMYGVKIGDMLYLADENGDLAFDEWDIHSYYSEYYMHN